MGKRKHGEKSRISEHKRAIRGYKEYVAWRELSEWLDTSPPVPLILRNFHEGLEPRILGSRPTYTDSHSKSIQALELLIKDKYTTFAVIERMKGEKK